MQYSMKPSMTMNPSHPSAAGVSTPRGPPPTLPTDLAKLILALAPIVNPYSAISSPDLLFVLPHDVAPLVFDTLILAANARDSNFPVNRLRFDRLITESTSDELVDSVVDGLYSRLGDRYETARMQFVMALARAGKVDVLNKLKCVDGKTSDRDCDRLLAASAASGCTDTFEWLCLRLEALGKLEPVNRELALDAAIEFGKMDMLAYIHRHNFVTWSLQSWKHASIHGQLDVLDWAKQRGIPYLVGSEHVLIDGASGSGHVDVLKWWQLNLAIKSEQYTVAAMDEASANGHINVLDWWSRSGLPLKFTPQAQLAALDAGHTEVIRFWSTCGEYRFLSGLDLDPMAGIHKELVPIRLQHCDPATLAAFGRLKWMQSTLPKELPRQQLWDVCIAAARFGHIHVLDHYRDRLQKLVPSRNKWTVHPIVAAAEKGQVSAMNWLMTHVAKVLFHDDGHRAHEVFEAANGAIENGHVGVVVWLLSNSVTRPLVFNGYEIVITACEQGSLPILALFAAERYLQMAPEDTIAVALEAAADQGHVKVFEWWQSNGFKWPEWGVSECPLHAALSHGRVQMLDWFLENRQCGVPWEHVDESMVAQLIADRHQAGLEWMESHTQQIGLCERSKRRISEFFRK